MSNGKESPHITALRKQEKLKRLAAEKFRVVDGKVEKYQASLPAQDIETVVAAAIAAEKLANPGIGDLAPGKGIFFGTLMLKNAKGELQKTFNMYAAPEDLCDDAGNKAFFYGAAADRIAGLRNWHGHDGASYRNDTGIFKALEDGSYKGGWFIPTSEMLDGVSYSSSATTGNLRASRDKGMFKGTFHTAPDGNNDERDSYWGSTQRVFADVGNMVGRLHARLSSDYSAFGNHEDHLYSCRPVRLELKP